jgi:predicted nuclease with TOPRIM domain
MGIPPVSEKEQAMSFGDKVVSQIREGIVDRRLPTVELSPLQKAFDDYNEMKAERDRLRHEMNELRIQNGALIAEVNMLRDSLERCDSDRTRLQSVSSTLLGQLMAINAVIADSVRLSIKNGVEAAEAAKARGNRELNKAGAEASEIIERITPTAVPANEYGDRP